MKTEIICRIAGLLLGFSASSQDVRTLDVTNQADINPWKPYEQPGTLVKVVDNESKLCLKVETQAGSVVKKVNYNNIIRNNRVDGPVRFEKRP